MKKIVILIGSFCYNRGSEALVRGTIDIVKKAYPDSEIVLSAGDLNFGPHLSVPHVDKYVRRQSYGSGMSLTRILSVLCAKILKNRELSNKFKYKNLLKECKNADLVIVSGGDNYDKSYNMIEYMNSVNRLIRKTSKAKMVMYDCSLEEGDIDDRVRADFALFDAITARENYTFDVFKRQFANKPVYYFPDPAFVMKKDEVELPEGFEIGNTVGVNVSSMVTESHYGSNSDIIIKNYVNMVSWILDNTPHKVMLIPHVMKNLDLKVLRILHSHFEGNDRVILVENEQLLAAQLKYIISNCVFYVGARTHSTIAAYSTCVPTLVLGYSIKSIGIARDLFGTEQGYVVSTKNLESETTLVDAFAKIYNDRENVKKHLDEFMPKYIDNTWQTSEMFKSILS